MRRNLQQFCLVGVIVLLAACGTAVPPTATPTIPSQLTFEPVRTAAEYCSAVDLAWKAGNWPDAIKNLELVAKVSGDCGGQAPALKLYPAWYNYGASLETRGQIDEAISAYRQALLYNPGGREAADALRRRAAFTPPPLEVCSDNTTQIALNETGTYTASSGGFISLKNGTFSLNDTPYRVRGINYYPARTPWRRFLTEADTETMRKELDLIRAAGFNTLRVFLWYEALFRCPGSGAVPNAAAFQRIDTLLKLAAERGLYVILTLNDMPDLSLRPLYTDPSVTNSQTAFVITRYREEPAILAWDLRNEGDIDYIRGYAKGRDVIDWLKATSTLVRQIDGRHLITAGWNDDAGSTRNAVDFISFHHWGPPGAIRERIAGIRAVSDKPVLLQEIGYSARGIGEQLQADYLRDALTAASSQNLLGWMIWTAFDYSTDVTCVPPACPAPDNSEHHFGLWHTDYTPKAALSVVASLP